MNLVRIGRKGLVAAGLAVCAACAHGIEFWSDDDLLSDGDTVVLIGDSITEQGFRNSWGYYHHLTNVLPQVNFIPLGYSGHQVKSWSDMERDSVANTNRWTWYRNPGWNLKTVFDGKVDVIVIFLGMNDILQPSIRDAESDIDRWFADYETFVKNLDARCRPRLFVFATITPLTADPLSPKNVVREKLNDRLRNFAREFPKAVVAEYGAAIEEETEACARVNASYKLVPDFVHPDDAGHVHLAYELCRTLRMECAQSALLKRREFSTVRLLDSQRELNVRVDADRLNRVTDDTFVYELSFFVFYPWRDWDPWKVRAVVPDGWTADAPAKRAKTGRFRIRGRPTALTTPVGIELVGPSNHVYRQTVDLPAPWKVRDETGEWKFYSASERYTGGMKPGSIEPFQLYFGWKTNAVTAARRVWSEKARDVKAVFSHQTFSTTLDLALKLNGAEVWKVDLNRRGKNRAEKAVHLNEGWNTVEITCVNRGWQRQFAFDFEPLDGDDLSALKYDIK